MHVRTEFTFEIAAPYDRVAPLFGAYEEQRWAEGWSPLFLHPQPPSDVEGAVFLVDRAIWVNTIFDLQQGRVQYVNLFAEVVTRIDIHLQSNAGATRVRVAYERTAISPSGEDAVRELAEGDRRKSPDWQSSIERALNVR